MARLRARLTYANVMATIAVFLAIGGGAYAVVGGGPARGAIEACYRKKGGSLRIVRKGTKCRRNERRVAWSQQGPQGLPGAVGPPGLPNPNAETLDGLDSSDFVLGGEDALIQSFRVTSLFQLLDFATVPGMGVLRGYCDPTGEKPALLFENTSGATLVSYFDDGGASPTVTTIAAGATENHAALGEPDHVTWQLGLRDDVDPRAITIIASVHDPPEDAECWFVGVVISQGTPLNPEDNEVSHLGR
jgi:hypothetical protein